MVKGEGDIDWKKGRLQLPFPDTKHPDTTAYHMTLLHESETLLLAEKREAERQRDREIERQRDRQRETEIDRQTDRDRQRWR